ncbi:MAG: Ger(x)C family spore germination C-terminal domain-containing protein [Clostridia bacterium]|nr:Ger(x)C family spore germination C-terminal domain-containing protein [Clostridia bacterium]
MRRFPLILLLIALCVILSGCAFRPEVENQAYVLVLGIERGEDGQLELTAKIPKIGKSTDGKAEGGAASPYQTFTAQGSTWSNALENLQWVTPRELNLSHVKLLVVSDALASEVRFSDMIRDISETPHLYTTAHFAVCDGDVSAFVEAQQPVIGTRLSSDIDAAMRHYAAHGYIPESLLAEIYCASGSFYSDPVAARCSMDGDEAAKPASLVVAPDTAFSDAPKEVPQRFGGCAVFSHGALALNLGIRETQLLSLALGNSDALELDRDGVPCALRLEGRPKLKVEIQYGAVTVHLDMRFSCLNSLDRFDAQAASEQLANEYEALIQRCQAAGVEPFGFATVAARRFLTNADWIEFDWPARFAQARADVSISILPGI